jgi:periplasmic divalent cation tolerance protein
MHLDSEKGKKVVMEHPEILIVLTTWPAEEHHPVQMAETLIEERLAACVNVLPAMESIYRWQGAVERAAERQVIIKTSRQALDPLLQRLASLHPYHVPEILVLPVSGGGEAYLRWVAESASGGPPAGR